MANATDIGEELAALKEIAPSGYAMAFHIRFTTPDFLFQTYPKAWLDHYSQRGYVMRDPTVMWGFENTGFVRWSDLAELDTEDIIGQAAAHGMRHGITYAHDDGGSRSIGSFTRSDRDFNQDEIDAIGAAFAALHAETARSKTLDGATREALKQLSIYFTHP